MNWISDTLQSFTTPEKWPGIVVALQVFIFVLFFRIVWIAFRTPPRNTGRDPLAGRAAFMLLRWGMIISVAIILVYQATWQLGGHMRPKFVEFMQLHDKRKDNPAHRMVLGRILDIKGRPLVENRTINGIQTRHYPHGEIFAHPIGHPRFTPSGLEKLALPHLAGFSLDDREDWARQASDVVRRRPPSGGQDLRTTLDLELQTAAFRSIGGRRGAAMAITLPEGNVVVMASRPAFDPNTVDHSIYRTSNEDALLINRCTAGMIPPGSIFKIAMAGLALELGIEPLIDCPAGGYTPVPTLSPIHDYQYNYYRSRGREWGGHGIIGMAEALAESSNVYFARLLVEHVGAPAFNDLRERFQWDKPIELYQSPVEPSNRLMIRPVRVDKASMNDPYALAQMSIGQGTIMANPGHMLMLGVAVANEGVLVRPRITLDQPTGQLRRVFTSDTARKLTGMMRGVVQDGTASAIRMPDIDVAGKTGSAQNPRGDSHGWFLGFAPANAPRMVICTVIENGGSGSESALPVARDILTAAQEHGYID